MSWDRVLGLVKLLVAAWVVNMALVGVLILIYFIEPTLRAPGWFFLPLSMFSIAVVGFFAPSARWWLVPNRAQYEWLYRIIRETTIETFMGKRELFQRNDDPLDSWMIKEALRGNLKEFKEDIRTGVRNRDWFFILNMVQLLLLLMPFMVFLAVVRVVKKPGGR